MTELRRANGLHKQHSLRDRQVHPMLHALADHGCNLSSGGNSAASTTSSSTATATTALGGAGGLGGVAGLNGGACITSQRSVEFDEHDIFYVSPSKRKGATSGSSGNVVTFSNFVSEQRLTPSSSNRGSLKRSKGRSNQSLCSCDAGDEAQLDLQPNAARPLYEYSLERKRKTHTYSCEQNAQILMRLERERNRKLSLTGMETGLGIGLGLGLGVGMGSGGGAGTGTAAGGGGGGGDPQSDTPSLSDVDVIPPVPPPPSMKRNGSMRSLRLLQHLQQQQQQQSSHNNNLSQLCSSDLLQECTKSALDECTATLLKCTTTSNHSSSNSNSNSNASNNCNIAASISHNNNNQVKPDLCQPPGHAHNHRHKLPGNATPTSNPPPPPPPFAAHEEDEIFSPHSKKSDPSLCFLPGGGNTSSKYNTIGPSSDYARHLAHYSRYLQKQHHQQQMAHFQQQRCRCFSQSLLSFPQQQQQKQQQQQQQQLQHADAQQHQEAAEQPAIFHTSSMDWSLPINSRSFGNLVNIDGLGGTGACRVPYQKMHSGTAVSGGAMANGCLGLAASSTFTLTSFDSDIGHGLKERESQTSLHHPHTLPHPHSHTHSHPHPHHYHAHVGGTAVGGAVGGSGSVTPQKHHQLHSSVTSIMPWKHRQCPSRGSSSSGTNSFRFDAAKHWLAVSSILLIIGAASVAVPLALRVAASAPFEERLRVAVQLLDQVPLIDGHNDLPWNIRKFLHNKLNDFNFDEDLRNVMPWGRSHWSHTDLTRLKKGRISAQFWAAYVPCEAQHRDAVQLTLEQIDVIKRLTDRYSPQLTTCNSAQDIIDAHKNQQLCSLTGVEGGHSLGGSLAVLRTLYAIGVRYMTLTSTCHTPWADSSYADAPTFNMKHGGLTIFGKTIIREMNRLGMMVDLSHVSKGTMRDALEVSEAPVIFSHSSAYELCNTSRNVQDDILRALAKNGGLVMVNFYSKFLSCSDNSTVHDAVAHINHIKRVAGIDHVGLGAGYDGINYTPKGLEDVSSYPTLFAELLGGGWTIDELTKLAGGNFLRVMQQVEKLRDDKKAAGVKPFEDHPNFRTDDPYNCTSS
ncbi:uncharacterized protein LOC6529563 [Drosophila yakuba]|uniref:Dipeptidase n=1 Tax=Drosophila yakuba TaxID=7245 RepID=A0A0R1DV33_DROYA|nr:uncharacterized protein LOC6529563 [Drosophila yakuba]XP_039229122.1 uncharacterized protein LOC6529563 [Drosophila yakuba]XP_039229123.1 uncharacterized protein LOC6529563 [Drosophila yakuba]KRJ99088.1 uncharacterized protein Dyak_GE12739, isoform B [Drosophila yakuba]KRJ99089.1 uncharacterized protein Dyak_GE12739, isoform C [Drosophila yakuba]